MQKRNRKEQYKEAIKNRGMDTAKQEDKPEKFTGRWTAEEHRLFLKGLEIHGKDSKQIAALIKTRNVTQVRTHSQKYFQKLAKKEGPSPPVTLDPFYQARVNGEMISGGIGAGAAAAAGRSDSINHPAKRDVKEQKKASPTSAAKQKTSTAKGRGPPKKRKHEEVVDEGVEEEEKEDGSGKKRRWLPSTSIADVKKWVGLK